MPIDWKWLQVTSFLGSSLALLLLPAADVVVFTRHRRLGSFGFLPVLVFLLLFFGRLCLFFVGQFTETI